jgi:hypothetical protein
MALEQQFIDDFFPSGSLVGVITKTVNVAPSYRHQPGRVLVVSLAWTPVNGVGTADIDSITVNGVSATPVITADNDTALSSIWIFPNPPAIASYDVIVTWADSINGNFEVYLLEQVDMASPVKNSGSNTGTGTTSTVNLGAIVTEEIALAAFAQFNGTTTTGTTTASPFTQDQGAVVGSSPLRVRATEASCTSTSSGALASTFTPAASKPFAHVACVFRAVAIAPLRGMMGAGI